MLTTVVCVLVCAVLRLALGVAGRGESQTHWGYFKPQESCFYCLCLGSVPHHTHVCECQAQEKSPGRRHAEAGVGGLAPAIAEEWTDQFAYHNPKPLSLHGILAQDQSS